MAEGETSNQRQARLRRERREAKIQSEGSFRLEKITNLAGRQNLAESLSSQPTVSSGTRQPTGSDARDRNSHRQPSHGSQGESLQPTEADIRAFLQASAPEQNSQPDTNSSPSNDPMVKMLAELLGGSQPETGGGGTPSTNLPPNLASLMASLGQSGQPQSQEEQEQATKDDLVWKVLHVLFAFALAVYVIMTSRTLGGKHLVRVKGIPSKSEAQRNDGLNLFWAFTTVELVLQSSRYFLERGKTASSIGGIMGTITTFLPEPWAGYVRLAAHYSGIWTTIVEDACVLIFTVGIVSWWRGLAG